MRRIRKFLREYASLIVCGVVLLLWFIAYIASHNFVAAAWVFACVLSVVRIGFLISSNKKILEFSDTLRAKNDELRKQNDEQSVLIRNLTTENAELRRKLSRKRPKPQTEEKSDE